MGSDAVMPSTAQQVARYLEEDLALKEVLARGILNLRRAARWMIAHEGWDASEEAVVSALRRFAGSSQAQALDNAREALAEAEVGVYRNLVAFTAPRSPRLHRRLRDVHHALNGDTTLVLLVGQTRVRLLVDGAREALVWEALSDGDGVGESEPLALVQLEFPADAAQMHAGVAIALSTLSQDGVGIREVYTCGSEFWIAVDEDEARRAFEAVAKLSGIGGEGG
jgi:hypothetical protein